MFKIFHCTTSWKTPSVKQIKNKQRERTYYYGDYDKVLKIKINNVKIINFNVFWYYVSCFPHNKKKVKFGFWMK